MDMRGYASVGGFVLSDGSTFYVSTNGNTVGRVEIATYFRWIGNLVILCHNLMFI